MNNKILFQEKQKFTQWWLWLFLLCISLFSGYKIFTENFKYIVTENLNHGEGIQVLKETHVSYNPWALIPLLILISILTLFYLLQLESTITKEGISVRYFPFLKRTFKWSDIETAEVIKYSFVGYGIRFSTKYGTIFNVKGNQGLVFTLKSEKKYIIGTQKSEELQRVVKEILD